MTPEQEDRIKVLTVRSMLQGGDCDGWPHETWMTRINNMDLTGRDMLAMVENIDQLLSHWDRDLKSKVQLDNS